MNRAIEEYLANLDARDGQGKSQQRIIDQYAKLAERASSAESKLRALETGRQDSGDNASAELITHLQAELASARAELTSAQSTKAASAAKLASLTSELDSTKQELATERSQRESWSRQAATLDRKLRDRNAEARESRKLVEQVQDEMIGLTLEKNMAEQRAERLKKENQELVDRWMEYKNKEAERINEQSRW